MAEYTNREREIDFLIGWALQPLDEVTAQDIEDFNNPPEPTEAEKEYWAKLPPSNIMARKITGTLNGYIGVWDCRPV